MRYLVIIFLIAIFFVACKKDNIAGAPQSAIVGKWNVITDSSSVTGSFNGFNRNSVYVGTPDDHFDFTSTGHLYIREGQTADTATYALSSDSLQVNISYTYIEGSYVSGAAPQPLNIDNLTTTHLTLSMPGNGLTPEGYFHRTIDLQK